MSTDALLIEAVSKLSLAPDDVVVIRIERMLTVEQMNSLRDYAMRAVPHENKVLVLDAGIRVEVLSPEPAPH